MCWGITDDVKRHNDKMVDFMHIKMFYNNLIN